MPRKSCFIGLQNGEADWIVVSPSSEIASYETSGRPKKLIPTTKKFYITVLFFVYIVLVILESHCHGIKSQMTKVQYLLALLIGTQFSTYKMRLIILLGAPQKHCEEGVDGQMQAIYFSSQ